MKVWNFRGVDHIAIGRDTIKEVWFRDELIWRLPTNPPGPDSWVDAAGTAHNFTFTWTWPDHNNYAMTMTVNDGTTTVVASESTHYGTSTDGSGELFRIHDTANHNNFWVMIDGFEHGWLYRAQGFPMRFNNVDYNPVTHTPVQL